MSKIRSDTEIFNIISMNSVHVNRTVILTITIVVVIGRTVPFEPQ
jgi:hypothetical protein